MFYDTERIVRKQLKYEKIKAYDIIQEMRAKSMSVSEMIDALEILLNDENTEFKESVLKRAKSLLEASMEADNEKDQCNSNGTRFSSIKRLVLQH